MQNQNQNQKQTLPQGGTGKKDSIKPVSKPYLTGKPWNRNSVKRALKVFGIAVAYTFIFLVVGSAMSMDSAILRILLNSLLILVALALMYNQGSQDGIADVTFGEICYLQKKEGRQVSAEDEARCYHRLHGLLSGLLGMLPFLLITVVYACIAVKQVYSLQTLPSWVNAYNGVEGIGDALVYYQQKHVMQLVDVLRLLERVICLPYANIFGRSGADMLLALDRLSPITVLLPAIAYWIGCLQGPRSRALVHGSIKYSQRRKERKRRREMKRRQKKTESRELI